MVSASRGLQVLNYIALEDCSMLLSILLLILLFNINIIGVYNSPTTALSPLFSLPRSTVIGIDQMLPSADGVWLHVYAANEMDIDNARSPAGSKCWVEAI